MSPPRFDRFLRYADLTATLEAFARQHPDLCSVASIGRSHEGRDLWLVTLTNAKTGPAADKPAYWVDGNIHATEVTASVAVLYFVHSLLARYGKDADVTRALDTRAFYVLPRMNPDGAEWALADRPRWIRSSTRPYPHDEDEIEGKAGTLAEPDFEIAGITVSTTDQTVFRLGQNEIGAADFFAAAEIMYAPTASA